MRDNKVIQILLLLAATLISNISAEYCEETGGNYTSYSFSYDGGHAIDELCKCMQANLETKGLLKGKEFYCVESRELLTIKWVTAEDVDGGRSECSACVPGGCEMVITQESGKICEIIRNAEQNETGIRRSKRKAALRFKCSLVVEVGWLYVGVHVSCG
ncbi:uncharacterized protein LOC119077349 [Bradysia coprophila]|uniref:uncharacterized protein LOC119077349 n=1 Tax=Bradysia coprophila TaxID=38358 RepID=UPI00187DAE45|nr:uncharacterized protein LOC119077349 [Bradysia coprophila]